MLFFVTGYALKQYLKLNGFILVINYL